MRYIIREHHFKGGKTLMTKIDLITGILGSGKTTWIHQYAEHLIQQGQRIAILENDFGAVNVDMLLLQELRGDQCELEMISGGCDNIFAEDCKMDSPNLDRVLRIKTNTCRGGINQNIYMRNIEVGQCKEAVMRINLVYEPNEIAERGHIPTVRNVYMENVTCNKSKYGVLINGLEDSAQIYNINVKNCTFNGLSANPIETSGKSHDVKFENVNLSWK